MRYPRFSSGSPRSACEKTSLASATWGCPGLSKYMCSPSKPSSAPLLDMLVKRWDGDATCVGGHVISIRVAIVSEDTTHIGI